MRQRLLAMAGALVLLAVLGKYYAQPLLAQVRAALVSDVDNPARGFVQLRFVAEQQFSSATMLYYDPHYLVPAGKRLVIDTISAVTQNNLNNAQPTGGLWLVEGPNAAGCSLQTEIATDFPVVIMPLTFQGKDLNDFIYGGIARVQAVVDSGHCLAVSIPHNAFLRIGRDVDYVVTISGHLVSYP